MPLYPPAGGGGATASLKVSAGTRSDLRTDVTFSNANGVSFGLDAAGVVTGTVATNYQSQGPYLTTAMASNAVTLSNAKVSAGTLSALRSDVTLADSNGVSFGLNTNGVVTATVATNYQAPGAYLTTAMRSDAATLSNLKLSASGGSVLGSDFTFANSNGLTFGLDTAARQFTGSYTVPAVPAQTAQTLGLYGSSNTTLTSSGTADARSLSVRAVGSLTVAISASEIVLSAPNALTTAMLSNAATISNVKLSASGGSVLGSDFTFANSNGLTFGLDTAARQFTASYTVPAVPAQSNQAVGLYASSNTTLTSSGTQDARSLSFRAVGSLTVGISAGEVVLSAPAALTTAMQSNAATISNIKMSGSGGSALGSDFTFANANGLTFGLDTAARQFTASYTVPSVPAQTAQSLGLYAVGNTEGASSSSTFDARTLSFQGKGVVSVGFSNGSVVIDAPSGGGGLTNVNLSAGATSQNLSAFVFSNSNNVSFGLSGSTVTASASDPLVSFFDPNWGFNWANSATSSFGLGTLYVNELSAPNNLSFGQVNMIGSASFPTTTAGNTITVAVTGANSLHIQRGYSVTCTNFVDLVLFSSGAGGSSSDLQTLASTRVSFVTFQNHTYDVSATVNVSTASVSLKSSASVSASFPGMTSGTLTSVNNATTVTTWGVGYTNWTSSISTSNSSTWNTTASSTQSVSLPGTFPAATVWASNKMIPMPFGTSLSYGLYWLGMVRTSSSSSSSSSGDSNVAAGRTYTSSIAGSNLTMSAQITWVGSTFSIASSLAWIGQNAANTLAPGPAQGTFTATYAASVTQYNNAGQANGEVALSDIRTNLSFWDNWYQLASNRI